MANVVRYGLGNLCFLLLTCEVKNLINFFNNRLRELEISDAMMVTTFHPSYIQTSFILNINMKTCYFLYT